MPDDDMMLKKLKQIDEFESPDETNRAIESNSKAMGYNRQLLKGQSVTCPHCGGMFENKQNRAIDADIDDIDSNKTMNDILNNAARSAAAGGD